MDVNPDTDMDHDSESDTFVPRIGLSNMGNTCFMNSILQCLMHCPPLIRSLQRGATLNTQRKKHPVIRAFAALVNAEDDTVVTPRAMKLAIRTVMPRFGGYAQHDAHEFLAALLDGLHEEMKRPATQAVASQDASVAAWSQYRARDASAVCDAVAGQLQSTLQCNVCNHTSTTYDPAWTWSVPVASTLDACMVAFAQSECLDGDDAPRCESCQGARPTSKQLGLWRLPEVLIVHLKRFSFQRGRRKKLHTPIDIPHTWNVARWVPPNETRTTYTLVGMANHHGRAGGGHYTATCRVDGQWIEFDDSRWYPTTPSFQERKEPYVLFYQRKV